MTAAVHTPALLLSAGHGYADHADLRARLSLPFDAEPTNQQPHGEDHLHPTLTVNVRRDVALVDPSPGSAPALASCLRRQACERCQVRRRPSTSRSWSDLQTPCRASSCQLS